MNEVLREEKKYLMTIVDSQRLSVYLGKVMMEDEHNGAEGYPIRSLYFDTLGDADYMEKVDGLEQRRKIRLRCYDCRADFAVLEMKQKSGVYQKKRSLRVSREDAQQLITGNYAVLLTYGEPFALECYALMCSRCYRPKAVVEYQRKAYIARENHTRITLDSHIIATESCFDIFSENLLQYPVLENYNVILEVKFNGFLLSYIKKLMNSVNRSEISNSKYCLARTVGLHYQD